MWTFCFCESTRHNKSLFTITDRETTFLPAALSRLKQAQFIWNAKEEHPASSSQGTGKITLSWHGLFKERQTFPNLMSCFLSGLSSFNIRFSTSTNAITQRRETMWDRLLADSCHADWFKGGCLGWLLATKPPAGLHSHPKRLGSFFMSLSNHFHWPYNVSKLYTINTVYEFYYILLHVV